MKRRATLRGLALVLGAGRLGAVPTAIAALGTRPVLAASAAADPRWRLEEREWKKRLSPAAYQVLRQEGTERPFSSALAAEKRPGTYLCAGCRLPLFASTAKYDSGTGWPSFWQALPGSVRTKRDFRLLLPRTEYHCRRCGGHQGHVFDDGPPPTGRRYCNNGVALLFLAS